MNLLPIQKKNNFFIRFIDKIKNFFYKEKFETNYQNDLPSDFKENIKTNVDAQIIALKVQLENGEINALDLTDSQIDELQKIYNEEISIKQHLLDNLKKRFINPLLLKFKQYLLFIN